jgi:hypothetical protein
MLKFFSEHNVSIADDVMPILDDNNMPIDVNEQSISRNLDVGDDNLSEASYDLMADISEQTKSKPNNSSPLRFGLSERYTSSHNPSKVWKIDEEDSSLSDGDNLTSDDVDPKNESYKSTVQRHGSQDYSHEIPLDDDNDNYLDAVDPILGVIGGTEEDMMEYMNQSLTDLVMKGKVTTSGSMPRRRRKTEISTNQQRRSGSSGRRSYIDPRKSGSSGFLSTIEDPQQTSQNRTDYLISRWDDLGFESKKQATILMSIASTATTPEERRKLCSKVEIKYED